ncbi:hypothetical protein [Oryzifoliimicrobium ureilyticus]|uniref:hypothetical protein n=1 Tax=Oryzifoliimicrobium ureilyticus TaxID=3113724 RepID=UPI0030762F8D
MSVPNDPFPGTPVPPGPDWQPEPPIKEPEPDRLPDETPNPNPDEVDNPPRQLRRGDFPSQEH